MRHASSALDPVLSLVSICQFTCRFVTFTLVESAQQALKTGYVRCQSGQKLSIKAAVTKEAFLKETEGVLSDAIRMQRELEGAYASKYVCLQHKCIVCLQLNVV